MDGPSDVCVGAYFTMQSISDRVARGKSRIAIRTVVLLALAWLGPAASMPQASGILSGTVTNANVPLPGARVTATMGAVERSTISREDGGYAIAGLPVGRYTVKAELAGFETVVREDVVV